MEDEFFGDTISTYTEKQAEEDGVLVDITKGIMQDSLFNYCTAELLYKLKIIEEPDNELKLNVPNLLDLLNNALHIVQLRNSQRKEKEMDTFYSGTIEIHDGTKQKIFMQQNSTGKYTIMLPEDY